MLSARIRRTLLTAAASLTFLVLAGATYQGVATAIERREFPRPGRLVHAGTHQLHIDCAGDGTPTVVLEAPAAGMSAAWGWVQPAVAEYTRVCGYDRAGLGWSQAGDRDYSPVAATDQLQALLSTANEQGPFVIAGQGLGAALAAIYASRFGGTVSALVLVDPPWPDAGSADDHPPLAAAAPWLARAGLLRALRLLSKNAEGLPEPAAGALAAFLNRPDHLTRSAQELARWGEAVEAAAGATLADDIHVTRLEAAGTGRVALLNDRDRAGAAAAAIHAAVMAVRAARP